MHLLYVWHTSHIQLSHPLENMPSFFYDMQQPIWYLANQQVSFAYVNAVQMPGTVGSSVGKCETALNNCRQAIEYYMLKQKMGKVG